MKKFLAILLAAVMLCGSFSIAAAAEERETLSILIAEDTLITSYDDNAFTTYVEEGANVDLEFVLLPATDTAAKLQLMISSGETLPDVLNYGMNLSKTYAYAQAGAIVPITQYIETLAPNVMANVAAYPQVQILEQITCADGEIYGLPRYFREINNEFKYRYWLNHQWLENLGMAVPTTTEEFYQVLKAFKEKDPNGNGIADEIPLTGAWSSHGSTYNLAAFLMNSFVQATPGRDYLYVEDGQMKAAYATEAWKQGLAYMNKLFEEGLIDANAFTQTSSQCLASLSNPDVCIVGCYSVQGAKDPYIEQFDGLLPLAGPEGVQLSIYTPTTVGGIWFVTADCDNPELAVKVGDFMETEEGFLRCRVGEPGISWVPAEEGDVSVFGEGEAVTFRWLDNGQMWTTAQNATWRQNAPLFAYNGLNSQAAFDLIEREVKSNQNIVDLMPYAPAEGTYFNFLTYTEDEEFAIADISSTLTTYVIESMVRFITGDMDVENEWDAYVGELQNIGLETFLEVAQAAYERQPK